MKLHRPYQTTQRQGERGNVMIFLFIAIALFAALSFAVGNMMRGGSAESVTTEKAKLYATDIIDYARAIRQTVQALKISGCDETELSFEKSPFDGTDADYVNGDAPGDFSCHVFHPQGGGIIANLNGPNGSPWKYTDFPAIEGIGSDCPASPSCTETLAVLEVESDAICNGINKHLNYAENLTLSTFPNIVLNLTTEYTGNSSASGLIASTDLTGKYTACIHGDPGDTNAFYQVLIAR